MAEGDEGSGRCEDEILDFLNFVPIPLALTGEGGRYVAVNDAFERELGFGRHEVIGRTPADLGIVSDQEGFEEAARRVGAGEVLRGYEMGYRGADGGERLGLFAAKLVKIDGQVLRFTGVVDITERKRLEEDLRTAHDEVEARVARRTEELQRLTESLAASEARFRALFQEAGVAIALADLNGRLLDVNPMAEKLFGYSRDELTRMSFGDLTHPEDLEMDTALFQEVVDRRRESYRVEKRYLTKEGRLIWGQLIVSLVGGLGAEPGFVLGMAEDITARKEAEEEVSRLLHDAENHAAELEAIIGSIADGVMITDTSTKTAKSNAAAADLLGLPQEVMNAPLQSWIDRINLEEPGGEPLSPERTATYRAAVLGITTRSRLERTLLPDGSRKWLSVSAAPLRSPEGELRGAVTTLSDVTELHELQQSQEDLLHIVSHDLRMPLAVIQGHVEVLKGEVGEKPKDPNLAMSLAAIERNCGRMAEMIDELVETAKLEGGRPDLDLTDVRLQSFLPDLLQRLRDVLPVNRVSVRVAPDLKAARADVGRLERIVLNLLTNALKYSEQGTPVDIEASARNGEVIISVRDSGCGIDADEIPKLFNRFYRLKKKGGAPGVGLGLYISKLLVEAHGGRIWVESRPREGSTFFFALPSRGTEIEVRD